MTAMNGNAIRRIVALVLVALVVLPAPALAHAHLESTKPASRARLTIAPRDLVLTFSEAPTLAMSALRLLGPDSTDVALGALGHGGGARTLTASITGALQAGTYTVLWQTAGDDGHVQHGSYQFVIADGAEGLAPAATTDTARRDSATVPDISILDSAVAPRQPNGLGVSSPIYVVIRWVQFVALLLLIGAVAFRWWILPRAGVAFAEPARRELSAGAARIGLWGAWFLALTALARLAAQLAALSALPDAPPSLGALLLHSEWGHGWLLEIVTLAFAIAGLRTVRREPTVQLPWRIAAAAVVGLAFVPALSGHAVAERSFAPFTVLFDGAHVLAAGAWLGTLAVMIAVGLPIARNAMSGGVQQALPTMVNAFSPLALTCAGILVFTGIVAARLHVASWSAFTTTTYGRTLLIKLAIVVLLILIGTWNWRRVKPTLATDGAHGLKRSATLELALGVVVLAVTAVLVALPTPFEMLR
jgi:copper transport protein